MEDNSVPSLTPVQLERFKREESFWREFDRSRGWLPPKEDGLLTEFGQGWLLGVNTVLRRESVLSTNRHWEAPPAGSVAHSIGYGLGIASPVLIPLCFIALWYAVWKLRKRAQLRKTVKAESEKRENAARVQALHELESGNLDPLAKAKAIEQSQGDSALAKSLYLKVRVEELMREE